MKCSVRLIPLFVYLSATTLFADMVELKDGKRIEGTILSENEDSLEVEVGRNEKGTIRQVLFIHSSEISSWVADKEGRISREKGSEVHRLGGTEYIEQLLRDAEKEIAAGKYDEGIEQFGKAADLANENLDSLKPKDRVDALNIRVHAFRLQLAALEGKLESIEKKAEGMQSELNDREKILKKDVETYKKDKEKFDADQSERHVQLGERYKQNDLGQREENLVKRQQVFKVQKAQAANALSAYEKDQIKTETQIKLLKEKVDQAEDAAKEAEKELRKR